MGFRIAWRNILCFLNRNTSFTLLVLTVNYFLFSQTDSSKHWQCICWDWSDYSSVLLNEKKERVSNGKLLPWVFFLFYAVLFVCLSGCNEVLREIRKWQSASAFFGKKSRERRSSQDGNWYFHLLLCLNFLDPNTQKIQPCWCMFWIQYGNKMTPRKLNTNSMNWSKNSLQN